MRNRSQIVFMRFIDGSSVKLRRQLLLCFVPVVDPDLDEIGPMRSEIAYGLPRLFNSGDDVGNIIACGIVGARSRPCQTAAHCAKERRIRMNFFTQLVRQLTEISSHADRGSEAVVGVPLKMVEEILRVEILLRHASVFLIEKTEMAVGVDHCWHDGLACQVNVGPARRSLKLALAADAGEEIVFDDEGRVLDRRLAITENEPRPFEQGDFAGLLPLDGQQKNAKAQRHKGAKFPHPHALSFRFSSVIAANSTSRYNTFAIKSHKTSKQPSWLHGQGTSICYVRSGRFHLDVHDEAELCPWLM